MDATTGLVFLSFLSVLFLAAVYWSLFKLRAESSESQQKVISELAAIRKSLEGKADKA